jgi:hypothetical protein
MNRLLILPFFLALAAPARAADKDAEDLAREVAPYLDNELLGVLHMDLSRLDLDEPFRLLAKLGLPARELDQARKHARELHEQLKRNGLKGGYLIYSLENLPYQPPLVVLSLAKDADDKGLTRLLEGVAPRELRFQKQGNFLVGGSEAALERVRERKPQPWPQLARALAAAGDAPLRGVIVLPDYFRRALEEIMPTLPKELGGGPTTVLTRGLQWVSLGVNPANTTIRVTAQTADEPAAKGIQSLIASSFKALSRDAEVREFLPDIDKITEVLLPKVDGDRLTLALKQEQMVALLAPAVKKAQEAARQAVSMNNLKQLALAFHMYHDVHNVFPASASYNKLGKPLLSWRVHLLPFLDQEKLYKEFRLDEPWDSEHNKKLIKRMPKVFISSQNRNLSEEGKTTYLLPTGPNTAFPGDKGLRIADILDGTSNTVLALDVDDEHAVIWTKPDDLKIDEKNPTRGLRKHDGKKFMTAFMDGSVRLLPLTIDPKTLLAIFSPSGGEIVNLP